MTAEAVELPGVVVITNCSVSRTQEPEVKVSDLPAGLTMYEALNLWVGMLEAATRKVTPSELYTGLGFQQIQRMFPLISRDHFRIVTGGQGCIGIDDEIVPYDFSANPKESHNIHQKVTREPFVIPVWWTRINERRFESPRPVADLIEDPAISLVVIAVQKFFMRYLTDDIVSTSPQLLNKLRIIKTYSGSGYIPMRLKPYCIGIPYQVANASVGNRNDVPQRACLNFLETLAGNELVGAPAAEQQAALWGAYGVEEGGIRPARLAVEAEILPDIEMNSEQADAALSALRSSLPSIAVVRQESAESGLIQDVRVFVQTLKQVSPNATFNAGNILTWLVEYKAKQGTPIELDVRDKQRIAQALVYNHTALGLERVNLQGKSGAFYRILQTA